GDAPAMVGDVVDSLAHRRDELVALQLAPRDSSHDGRLYERSRRENRGVLLVDPDPRASDYEVELARVAPVGIRQVFQDGDLSAGAEVVDADSENVSLRSDRR